MCDFQELSLFNGGRNASQCPRSSLQQALPNIEPYAFWSLVENLASKQVLSKLKI